jgi:signal transduction histidine kinase
MDRPPPTLDLRRICDDDARRILRFAAPLVAAILVLEGFTHLGGDGLALVVVPWIAALPVAVTGLYAVRPPPSWAPPERYWPLVAWLACHILLLLHMAGSTVWGAAFFMLAQLFASAAFMLARGPMLLAVLSTWGTLVYWKVVAMPGESWAFVAFALPLALGVHFARYRSALLAERERLAQLELAARREEAERFHRLSALSRAFAEHFEEVFSEIVDADRWTLTQLPAGHPGGEGLRTSLRAARNGLDLLARLRGENITGTRPRERFSPATLLDDATLRAQVAPPHRYDLVTAEDLPEIVGDPARLRAALLELIGNAVDSLPEQGGMVRVEFTAARGGLEISVIDSGHGLDEADRQRALEPFHSTRRDRRGLGLTFVLGVVEQSGGTLVLESQPGVGTRVRVHLPTTLPGDGREALLPDAPAV